MLLDAEIRPGPLPQQAVLRRTFGVLHDGQRLQLQRKLLRERCNIQILTDHARRSAGKVVQPARRRGNVADDGHFTGFVGQAGHLGAIEQIAWRPASLH